MRRTESDGRAMKKSLIGRERPGVEPSAHVVPREPDCALGTKTRRFPPPSTYRNGFSRLAGVVASVVYGWSGNDCGGAPFTPAKTWFHSRVPAAESSRARAAFKTAASAGS